MGPDAPSDAHLTSNWRGINSATTFSAGVRRARRMKGDGDEAAGGARRRYRRDDGGQQAAPPAGPERVADHRGRPERRPLLPAGLPVRAVRRLRPERRGQAAPAVHPGRRRAGARRDRPGRPRRQTRCCSPTAANCRYDYLVIATGTSRGRTRPRACSAPQWRRQHPSTSTPSTGRSRCATRCATSPAAGSSCTSSSMPIKCPVAPLEFAFLADAYFRERGHAGPGRARLRDAAAGRVHQADRLRPAGRDARRPEDRARARLRRRAHRRRDARRWSPTTSARCRFDLLVTVPLNMGADFIARSGLGDELNYVPVDKHTLLSNGVRQHLRRRRRLQHPDLQGRLGGALLDRGLRRQLPASTSTGRPMTGSFDGHANCFVEAGDGKAPADRLQLRHRAAARHLPAARTSARSACSTETRVNHWGKLAFRWMYWHLLLPGRPIPLPAHMSMAGKHQPRRRRCRPCPSTTICGHEVHVDAEGFLTDYDEWDEDLAEQLAAQIGIDADRRALEGDPVPARGLPARRARPPRCAGCPPSAGSR